MLVTSVHENKEAPEVQGAGRIKSRMTDEEDVLKLFCLLQGLQCSSYMMKQRKRSKTSFPYLLTPAQEQVSFVNVCKNQMTAKEHWRTAEKRNLLETVS